MAGPPAVAWVVKPSTAHRFACGLGALIGVVTVSSYIVLQPWGGISAVLLLLVVACVGVATNGVRREHTGTVLWDGEHWHGAGWADDALSRLQCVLDFQRWMLLRAQLVSGEHVWLWVESDTMNLQWLAFRRALVFGAARAVQDDAQML